MDSPQDTPRQKPPGETANTAPQPIAPPPAPTPDKPAILDLKDDQATTPPPSPPDRPLRAAPLHPSPAPTPPRPPVPPSRLRIHAAYLLILLLTAASALLYTGLRRETSGSAVLTIQDPPGTGTVNSATPPTLSPTTRTTSSSPLPPSTLRLATFNIRSGRGMDDRTDLTRTAETVRRWAALGTDPASYSPALGGAAVVALHEVSAEGSSGLRSNVETLAGLLTTNWVWSPAERRWWRDDFGNAALLWGAVESATRIPLPQTQERGHRNVLTLRIRLAPSTSPSNAPNSTAPPFVTVLATHVDRRVDQPAQLRFLVELFRSIDGPAVLMGDLNVPRTHPVLRELLERHGATDATLPFPETSSPGQIELIYTKGLRTLRAGKIDLAASDHPLLWADLAPNPAPR